jgi:hypothetical protein
MHPMRGAGSRSAWRKRSRSTCRTTTMFDAHFRGSGISTCDNLDDLAGSATIAGRRYQ